MLGGDDPSPSPGPPTRWNDVCSFLRRLPVEAGEAWVSLDPGNGGAPPARACSLCCAGEEEVAKLIAGPAAFICDGCVAGSDGLLSAAHEYCLGGRAP